jgi:hypothetical protein
MRGRKRTADDADVAGGRREGGCDRDARVRRSDGAGGSEARAMDAEEDVLKVRCEEEAGARAVFSACFSRFWYFLV